MKGRATNALRSLADIEADYAAVQAAYRKALVAESLSLSTAAGGHTLTRSSSDRLREQMLDLEREYFELTNGQQKIKMTGATPID